GAYKRCDGGWTDTDSDNIPDIVEIYFSNITWIDNDTMWQQMRGDNGLGDAYGWCRDYYHELNASNSSAAENWTQKAFNPFVQNTMPPMIVNYSVRMSDESWTDVRITYECNISDIKGIVKIVVELSDLITGWSITREHTVTWGEKKYFCSGSFVVSKGTVTVNGVRLKITVWNIFWEAVYVEKEYRGILSEIVKEIEALAQMLAGGLQEVWNAVEKAVNAIVEWVKEIVKKMMDAVVEPIKAIILNFVEQFGVILKNNFKCGSPIEVVGCIADVLNSVYNFIVIPILTISSIVLTLEVIELTLKVFSGGISDIVSRLSSFICEIIMASIVGMGVIAGALMATSPTFESALNLMGDAGTLFDIGENLISAFNAIVLWCLGQGAFYRGVCFSILSLIVATLSGVISQPGYVVFLLDLFSAVFAIVGLYIVITEKPVKSVLTPLVQTIAEITAITAVVGLPMVFGDHLLNGIYTRS
ncbi:MAG: hypothetical protein QXS83_04410, partial [Thermoplasmata archaeon]